MKLVRPALFAAACLVSIPAAAQSADPPPVLAPGDAVRITVWRKPELSGEFVVSPDSTVGHPFYSDVKVAGVELPVAQDRIRRYVAQYESNPRVLVEPLLRVTVGGEVRQPNLYTLRPETTVSQAVAMAGGATDRGRLERVRLLRDGTETLVDLTRPETAVSRMRIRSGDEILVTRRGATARDYVAPAAAVVAALASFLNILLR
jgi:protein involved in polysaccharide export with SLBB domain